MDMVGFDPEVSPDTCISVRHMSELTSPHFAPDLQQTAKKDVSAVFVQVGTNSRTRCDRSEDNG